MPDSIPSFRFDLTYWRGKYRLRQLTSPADDLTQFYFNLGCLVEKLISEPFSCVKDKCICIKLTESKL